MIIAIYGKGGIGKSTIASNLSALLGSKGKQVLQVGCDPKHDSTYILAGRFIRTVAEVLVDRRFDVQRITAKDIVFPGSFGTSLVEVGGPDAGKGCGGYVVGETIEILRRLDLFDKYDYILFDVLGDVVCGGFAVPMNLASIVFVVAGNDFDSLFAANRINAAIVEKSQYYPIRSGGLVGNKCNEEGLLKEFCRLSNTPFVVGLPFSRVLHQGRQSGRTLLEMKDSEDLISYFERIALHLQGSYQRVIPGIIPDEQIFGLFSRESEAKPEH
ncbi:MAG: AAA family ATPase [Planctomycetota bacterium]|jgi:light-independent protochlorophyllide reductase subunit L